MVGCGWWRVDWSISLSPSSLCSTSSCAFLMRVLLDGVCCGGIKCYKTHMISFRAKLSASCLFSSHAAHTLTLSFFPPTQSTQAQAHCSPRHGLITSAYKMAFLDFAAMTEAETRQWLSNRDRSAWWVSTHQDVYGRAVLHVAAGWHSTDFVAWLVDEMGGDIHCRCSRGRTPLHN